MSVQNEIMRISTEISEQTSLIEEISEILANKTGGEKLKKVLVGVNSEDGNDYNEWAEVGQSFTAVVGTSGDPSVGTEGKVRDADGNIVESVSEKFGKYTVKVSFTVPDRSVMVEYI